MQPPTFATGIPAHDLLLAAGKLVAMLARRVHAEEDFAKLFVVQGEVEDFAGAASTPLEADLAQAMLFMVTALLQKESYHTSHPHAELLRAYSEVLGWMPFRFIKAPRRAPRRR